MRDGKKQERLYQSTADQRTRPGRLLSTLTIAITVIVAIFELGECGGEKQVRRLEWTEVVKRMGQKRRTSRDCSKGPPYSHRGTIAYSHQSEQRKGQGHAMRRTWVVKTSKLCLEES